MGRPFGVQLQDRRPSAAIKGFTNDQDCVWYETQRELDFMRTVDLMARRGRMVVLGRQASRSSGRTVLHEGSVATASYVQRDAGRTAKCAEDINRWLAERNCAMIGFPLPKPPGISRGEHRAKAGTLTGKMILVP